MTSLFSVPITSRFTFWRPVAPTLLSVMLLICLHFVTARAEETVASTLTLHRLQVNRSGISSSFTITNTGAASATLHQSFRTDAEPDAEVFSFTDGNLLPGEARNYDLGGIAQLPDGFRGFVTIISTSPLTGTSSLHADFFSTKREGNPPFVIQFVDTSIGDYNSRLWDFGDGQTSTEMTPTHTYAVTGTYSVKLTISGGSGSDVVTKSDLIKVHSFPSIHPDGWDLDFGNYGQLSINDCGGLYSFKHAVHLQSDGKILVALECSNNVENIHRPYISRYLSNGAIDVSFGQFGQTQTPMSNWIHLGGLIALPDGKFIVSVGLRLIGYTPDGSVDPAFGIQGIADYFTATNFETSQFKKLIATNDGKIVAIGSLDGQPLLVRFNMDGTLDTSFDNDGYAVTNTTSEAADTSWEGGVVFGNDKILVGRLKTVAVDIFSQTEKSFSQLSRFNSNGSIDMNFGVAGVIEQEGSSRHPLTVLPDNKVYVEEISSIPGSSNVIRLHYNGTVDETFHTTVTGNVGGIDQMYRMYRFTYDSIQRMLPDGSLDLSFGKDGWLQGPGNTQTPGFIYQEQDGNLIIYDDAVLSRYIDDHPSPPPVSKPLTLLYAVLDNNLGEDATRLVNNVEAGVRPGMNVRLLIDGPGENDVYLYNVMQDNNPFCPSASNPTCDGRYAEGINFWHLDNENSAHPDSLYQFVVDGINAFTNTSSINLALIGHGSGWSANVLPGQPSIWRGQNDTLGGMLWDDHIGVGQTESRSLSTLMLGQALSWASKETGRTIDLLYLDGCSMGMAEVAYELRESAKLLLASPNIDWASFNYDELLPQMATYSGQELGKRWLTLEASRLRSSSGYPFTLSLVDLNKLDELAVATSGLAAALQAVLPSQRSVISNAYQLSDKFDSNYDGAINPQDAYVDLGDFAQQLAGQLSAESEIITATQAVQHALNATIVAKEHEDGAPWMFPDQPWAWRHYSGLAIYAPLGQDEARRQIFYNASNLSLAKDTSWDEFLAAYWTGTVQAAAAMPICHQTSDGCVGLANPLPVQAEPVYTIFMPLVAKK